MKDRDRRGGKIMVASCNTVTNLLESPPLNTVKRLQARIVPIEKKEARLEKLKKDFK